MYYNSVSYTHLDVYKRQLVNLRMMLNETEVARYHEIGQECANIVEKVAMEARPGQTEKEVAALLKMRCIDKGILSLIHIYPASSMTRWQRRFAN